MIYHHDRETYRTKTTNIIQIFFPNWPLSPEQKNVFKKKSHGFPSLHGWVGTSLIVFEATSDRYIIMIIKAINLKAWLVSFVIAVGGCSVCCRAFEAKFEGINKKFQRLNVGKTICSIQQKSTRFAEHLPKCGRKKVVPYDEIIKP